MGYDNYDANNSGANKGAQPISPMNVNSRPGGTTGNSQQMAGEADYNANRSGGCLGFLTCRGCR
jgi:casein kinase 1